MKRTQEKRVDDKTEVGAVEEGERAYLKVQLTGMGVGRGCDRRRSDTCLEYSTGLLWGWHELT